MNKTNLKRDDFEVMAPVGSFESLRAAIQGGANAVYFGLDKLNMRSRSSVNFTDTDLAEIVRIARKHNVKTYLTLNIVIYNNELERMRELVDLAKIHQVDAIIASDQSVIQYAFDQKVEVHLSTQLNISNIETVKFYARYADVMVLARELNLEQVHEIYQKILLGDIRGPKGNLVQLEMFVHGALCMSISGKCYLSLHEYNYSANRGACLQTCRRSYRVTDTETERELVVDNEYIMSPKDLKTIHFLNKLADAGVRVFKIEGRARPAEYVRTVTACYSEAASSIADGSFTAEKIAAWDERLKTVFNRGFWDGYYLGQRLGEWSHVYGSKATQKKLFIGPATNYFPKIGVAEFSCEANELNVGDEILITGPTTGVLQTKVDEMRVDLQPVKQTQKGDRFSIATPEKVRRSDKLYKLVTVTENKFH